MAILRTEMMKIKEENKNKENKINSLREDLKIKDELIKAKINVN